MIVLGIYPGHNAAVCILRDGEVLLNLELERYSRIKHDYGYRSDFLCFCLRSVGLSIADVDLVAANRWIDTASVRSGTIIRPCEIPPTGNVRHVEFTATILTREIPAVAVNHHLAHVSAAYYTSPFDEATVCTFDGGGDNENGAFARCVGNRIEEYQPQTLEMLAAWWSSVTLNNYRMPRLHEWDPGSGAGKIMALAAYGTRDAGVAAQLQEDMAAAVFSESYTDPASMAFNGNEDLADARRHRSQALARALQDHTERSVGALFREAHRRFPGANLCYAGGLALNCVANSAALTASPFSRLHVPPCPNDTGIALGAALYAYHQVAAGARSPRHFNPYTGPEYASEEIDAAVAVALQAGGVYAEQATTDGVVDALVEGDVLAVWRQRGECGPRALGHRSLLARPDLFCLRDQLNAEVKHREWYRPYAPIILAERAAELLEAAPGDSPYMTTSATVRPEWRQRLIAVCHVDGSTRPQLVTREHEPFVYDLIAAFAARTGIPAILNTSFNRQGPIVESPLEAVQLFLAMPIGRLLIGDRLLSKRDCA